MEFSTRPVQRLSPEQLVRIKDFERMKYRYRRVGLEDTRTADIVILVIMRYLVNFLISYHYREIFSYEVKSSSVFLLVICYCWIALCPLEAYNLILLIKETKLMLEREKMLRIDVDGFARNVQDSLDMYHVTSDFGVGPAVLARFRISPHISGHGECISQLALLKELVEEPSVEVNFKLISPIVAILLSCVWLFCVGLAVNSLYTTDENGSWDYEDLTFNFLEPT